MSAGNLRRLDVTEQKGVNAVEKIFLDFGWIMRDQRVGDYGIDAQVEIAGADGAASGRLIALQIKAGPSYFTGNARELQFYPSAEHVAYWTGHSLPVAVVFHHPDTGQTLWQWADRAIQTGKRWRLTVPRTQTLESAKDGLAEAADRGRTLSPSAAFKLGREVAEEVSAAVPRNLHSSEVVVASLPPEPVKPLIQAAFSEAGLSPLALDQLSRLFDDKLRTLHTSPVGASTASGADPRRKTENQALHAKIDQLRDIKNEGDAGIAYRKLKDLLPTFDRVSIPYAWFRVQTNIAACALDIGLDAEAATGFRNAYALEPETPLAIANLALAQLLDRDYEAALDTAQRALNLEPRPDHALTILLGAAARSGYAGDPRDLLPEAARTSDEAEFALLEFARIRDEPDWPGRAIAAFETRPNDTAFKRLAAFAVLEVATTDARFIQGGVSEVSREQVLFAAETLREAVERKISGGYADHDDLSDEATNAAIAYRAAGEFGQAIALLRRVLALTGPKANATRMLGLTEALNDNEAAALVVFETIPDDGEAQLLRCEILGESDPAAGHAAVLALPEAIIPDHLSRTRWVIAANLAIRMEDPAAITEALDRLREDASTADYADLLTIQQRSASGEDKADVVAALEALSSRIGDDALMSLRVTLARMLRAHGAPLKASRVLDGRVDLQRDTKVCRFYLELLAEGGRDTEFAEIIQALPKALQDEGDILWIRAVQAFNRGGLDVAETLSRRLTSLRPRELSPTLLLLETLVRRGRSAAIRKILGTDVEALTSASLKDRTRLGQLLTAFGGFERGLALVYRLLLENRNDPKLWTRFGGLVLGASRDNDGKLDMKTVAPDAWVTLAFDDDTTLDLVTEEDPALLRLDADARETAHPDVQAILGLTEGDAFTLPDGRTGRVSAVRHKYVGRMQAVLKAFEQRFPAAQGGFKSVRIDLEAEGGLDEIKAILKARADFVEQEAGAYDTGVMPLAIFAHRIGIDTIDAASGLGQTGRKFHVARGDDDERTAATKSLEDNGWRGAVVDTQTFWTLWSLGAAQALEATLGKLHYSAGLLIDLQQRLERLEFSRDEDGTQALSLNGDEIVIRGSTPESVAETIQSLKDALAWLDANAILTPVTLPNTLSDDMRAMVVDMPSRFLDEIFIANSGDLLLLVDDYRIRQWAEGFGVSRSTWLHWALAAAVDADMAELTQYARWSAALLDSGQSYLGLSPQVFFAALDIQVDAKSAQPGEIFAALTLCLGGASAEIRSHVRIAAQIIAELWRNDCYRELREAATSRVLTRLITERDNDYPFVLGALIRVFANHRPFAARYIRGWVAGHFLHAS